MTRIRLIPMLTGLALLVSACSSLQPAIETNQAISAQMRADQSAYLTLVDAYVESYRDELDEIRRDTIVGAIALQQEYTDAAISEDAARQIVQAVDVLYEMRASELEALRREMRQNISARQTAIIEANNSVTSYLQQQQAMLDSSGAIVSSLGSLADLVIPGASDIVERFRTSAQALLGGGAVSGGNNE